MYPSKLSLIGKNTVRLAVWCLLAPAQGGAQDWDLGARAASAISGATGHRLTLSFDLRGRYEDRTGNTFGKDVDVTPACFGPGWG